MREAREAMAKESRVGKSKVLGFTMRCCSGSASEANGKGRVTRGALPLCERDDSAAARVLFIARSEAE